MRTTSGADAFCANDRPPDDATFVKRLRDAGAIILAKANMGEYAAGGITGTRSSFGGTMCNAYDTERDPGASSGGSGIAVAANLVTCAIGEETGTSVREPAKNNNAVGIAPTRELVSADGMIQRGITTRVGPICRTVRGRGADPRRLRRLRPEGRADGVQRSAASRRSRTTSYATKRRLDGDPHRRRARVHGQATCSRSPTSRRSTSSTARSTTCARSARRSSTRARAARCSRAASTSTRRCGATSCSSAQFPTLFPVDATASRRSTTSRR